MSRRMDREGVHRMEPQGIQNHRFTDDPRCVPDAKGWLQPFTVWQGWDELNQAAYALRCLLIWRSIEKKSIGSIMRDDSTIDRTELYPGMACARMESDLRTFHFCIARTRRCDRPRLP